MKPPPAEPEPAPGKLRRPLAALVRVLLSLSLLLVVFAFVPMAEVGRALAEVDLSLLVLAAALTLVSQWIMAVRMSYITARQGLSLSSPELFRIGLMSAYYGLFLAGQMASGVVR